MEDRESPNSHVVVEAGLDEIPSTSSFDYQMFQSKYVESPNSHMVFKINLNKIPLTLGVDSAMLHSLVMKVSPFHVIFDLNGVMITTCFDKGYHTIIPRPRLKEFLEKCFA